MCVRLCDDQKLIVIDELTLMNGGLLVAFEVSAKAVTNQRLMECWELFHRYSQLRIRSELSDSSRVICLTYLEIALAEQAAYRDLVKLLAHQNHLRCAASSTVAHFKGDLRFFFWFVSFLAKFSLRLLTSPRLSSTEKK